MHPPTPGYPIPVTVLLTTVGAALVLLALRDIFRTLWHPRGFGPLARVLFRLVWRGTKVLDRRSRSTLAAGPLALLATSATWTTMLVVGFALMYLPHMPGQFFFASSLEPAESSDLVASVYLSLVALATLGLGDISPGTTALRLLVPLEALLGFVLLTAAISWVLQLYPALTRRRSLARRLDAMARHGTADVVRTAEPAFAGQVLEGVRAELATIEMDLLQYGESYYFREQQSDASLAAALPHVSALVAAGETSAAPEVRHAATLLRDGLESFLRLLRRDYLGDAGDREATLAAYAADHRQPVPGET